MFNYVWLLHVLGLANRKLAIGWLWQNFIKPVINEGPLNREINALLLDWKPCFMEVMEFFTHAFGHLMRRADSFEKTLMLGKIEVRRREDDRGWDGWMASLTQQTWVWVDSGSWWWTGRPGVLRLMGSQRVGHDWVTELNWRWLPVDIVTDGYPFLKKYFYWRIIDLQSCVSGAQQSDSVTYIFNLFQILSHIGYYRILSRVAYAI